MEFSKAKNGNPVHGLDQQNLKPLLSLPIQPDPRYTLLRLRHRSKAKIDHRTTKIDQISGSSEFGYLLKFLPKMG